MKKILIMALSALLLAGCACKNEEQRVESVILMIGDGMGLAQITALAMSQDYEPLHMERAKYAGLQKTYSANNRVTDSAAAGTALATGSKTYNAHIAVTPEGESLTSSLSLAQYLGKATGFVVTCSVTGATPSAFYAHHTNRRCYEEIAMQLPGSGIDVIAGSGLCHFSSREDGLDLSDSLRYMGYSVTTGKRAFLETSSTPAALLMDGPVDMPYALRDSLGIRGGDYLAEATAKALELLDGAGKDGLFLMVEGSLIDYACHDHLFDLMLGEMRDFDNAVKVAYDYADANPGTLVIVTGDHETGGLTIIPSGSDYTSADEGVEFHFSTHNHSGTFIPVFAYGTGAENFSGVMENTEIALRIKELMEK